METDFTQQEILLNIGTKFLTQEWCAKNDTGEEDNRTEKEKLEEACWNGLLKDILPELFKITADTKSLTLWKVTEMSSFLELELADHPSVMEKYFSINPYSFLTVQEPN